MECQKKKEKQPKSIYEINGLPNPPPPPMNPALMHPLSFGVLDSTDCVSAAVPVENFVYPGSTATAAPYNHAPIGAAASNSYTQENIPIVTSGISSLHWESDCEDQRVAEGVPLFPERDLLTATYIPSYDDNTADGRAYLEKELVATGTMIGKIKNLDSDDAVQNGLRNSVYSNERHLKEKIRIANKKGRKKDKEGFSVNKEDPYFNELALIKRKQDSKQSSSNTSLYKDSKLKETEGYDVSEYKTTEYSTETYQISDYKSVYGD